MTDAANAESIPAHAARQPNICSPTCRKASARFRTVSVQQTKKRGLRAFAAEILPIVREIQASGDQPPWSR